MEEKKEAGEGGAFPARGDHCCQVFTPTTRACAGSDLRLLYVWDRESAELGASSPHKLFHYPPERGKAIADLYTKGKIRDRVEGAKGEDRQVMGQKQ